MIPINQLEIYDIFSRPASNLSFIVEEINKEEKLVLLQGINLHSQELQGFPFWVKNNHSLITEQFRLNPKRK